MKYLIAAFLLIAPFLGHAAVYKQVDTNTGKVTYSDVPLSHDAETIEVNVVESQQMSAPPPAPPAIKIPQDAMGPAYKSFKIISPVDQATFQNQPTIPLVTKSEPILQQGDQVQVLLDGKLFGNPIASNNIDLNNVERGSHTLSAAIVDQNQKVLIESNTITMYVHKGSVFQPSRQAQ